MNVTRTRWYLQVRIAGFNMSSFLGTEAINPVAQEDQTRHKIVNKQALYKVNFVCKQSVQGWSCSDNRRRLFYPLKVIPTVLDALQSTPLPVSETLLPPPCGNVSKEFVDLLDEGFHIWKVLPAQFAFDSGKEEEVTWWVLSPLEVCE